MNSKITSELKLPAVGLGLMFFAGCLTGCAAGETAALAITAAALVMTVVSFILRRGRIWAVGLLLGLLSIGAYQQFYVKPLEQLSGSDIRAEFRIVEVSGSASGWTNSTAVCVLNGFPAKIYLDGAFTAEIGDSIDAVITLEKAEENAYAFSHGVILSGRVQEIYGAESHFSLLYYADKLRTSACQRLDSLGGDEAELCKGLLLGETGGFSLKLRRDITYSGVNYMTAVSGAHITICIAVLTQLFGDERRRTKAWLSSAAAVALALFFGFSPSVLRAGIMLIILNFGTLLRRKADAFNSLSLSLLLLTIFTPFAAADPALQMSALGVFGTAVLGDALCGLRKFPFERFRILSLVKRATLMSLGAVVCITPVSVSLFGGISLAQIPASVALSPFFTAAMILGVLLAVSGIPLLELPLKAVMTCFRSIIGFFGELDGVWLAADFSAAVIVAALSAVLLIIAAFIPEQSEIAMSAFILSLVLTVCLCLNSAAQRRRIDFVSDGNSGSAVICSRSEAVIIISGGGSGLGDDLYDELMRSGISHVRLINAPQLDYGGLCALGELAELFPADRLLCPEVFMPTAEKCTDIPEILPALDTLSVNGRTIACVKSGSDTDADIALYYGYTLKTPESRSALPLYVSSRQKLLPDGGINIYKDNLRIELKGEQNG